MKSVVFTFGRMNPPTTGHQLLVNKLVAHAHQSKSTPRVYLSHSVGKKDPLSYDKKLSFARAAFGAIVRKSNSKNVIQILKDLEKEGFTHVTMFAGSDRVPEFTKLLNTYNGKEYTFEKITVKSAGERDPDADDVSGMSASKMRALAKNDKVAEFLRGAPNTLKAAQAKTMFTAVRKALLGEDVMEYGHDEKFLEFIFESDNKDDDLTDLPSEGEIAKHFDSLDADDLDLDDADAMMLDIILDREEDKEEIEEARVLNIQQRQKLAQRMKAMSKRLARLRQIKAKQMPAQQRLRMRARKAALMLLRKRATGKKNLEYSSLSRSQRIAVDTALVQRFGKNLNSLVGRLATRLMPRVRKHAQEYMKKAREEVKEQTLDPKTKKQVPDQAKDNPLNLDALKIDVLHTDPQKNDRVAPNPKKAHLHKNRHATHFKTVDEGRKGTVDQQDAGDTNIVYQMRKVVNSRGEHETVFADKHKAKISVADAKKMLAKFDALRMPADKHDFTVQAGKSLAAFKDVMAHGVKKEKKKISLGGKQFKEFYLGVGRSRTVSAYDNDEPPGTRRVAEAAKDEDRPEDPNRSRPLSQKLDLLLRLGLADTDDLQKYRRALRSSKKAALQSPEMRAKLADLLDKLIDLTTQDPATYSRVRYRVQTKEAMSLLNKAEKSGIDIDILAEVFMRELEESNDTNRAFNRVNSFIAGGKAAEMDKDLIEGEVVKTKLATKLMQKKGIVGPHKFEVDDLMRNWFAQSKGVHPKAQDADAVAYHGGTARFYDKSKGTHFDIKGGARQVGVIDKSGKIKSATAPSPVSYKQDKVTKKKGNVVKFSSFRKKDTNEETDVQEKRGLWDNIHAKRARIKAGSGERMRKPGSKGAPTDAALKASQTEDKDPCWSDYKQVGMKMKNGRQVPNCVPKEAVSPAQQRAAGAALATQRGEYEGGKKGGAINRMALMKKKELIKLATKKKETNEGQANWARARKDNERTTVAYLNRTKKSYVDRTVTPYKADDAKIAAVSMKDFLAKGGKIQQIAPGKTTIKSYVKPKKYMTPNQASKITEQNMTTHEPTPLSKRAKRVKSFHAWHPPVKEAVQRHADIKMVKVRMPDGSIKFRKEKVPAKVQHEAYTGSEPTSTNPADPASRFVGTNAIRQTYANVTPGQGSAAGEIAIAKFAPEKVDYTSSMAKKTHTEIDQSKENLGQKNLASIRKALGGIRESHDLNEAFAAGFELAPFARDYGITVQSSFEHHPEVQEALDAQEDAMNEAIYQGRQVPLNKPMKGDVKKSKVYVRDPSTGNVKKVNFGDKKLSIKKDQPARKRSYCARSSGQGNLTKKTSANYWSRRAWNC